MIVDGTKICNRCEKDSAGDVNDCETCRVYGLCADCLVVHQNTCLIRIREKTPDSPVPLPLTPPRGSAIDSPLFWIAVLAASFAALLAKVVA